MPDETCCLTDRNPAVREPSPGRGGAGVARPRPDADIRAGIYKREVLLLKVSFLGLLLERFCTDLVLHVVVHFFFLWKSLVKRVTVGTGGLCYAGPGEAGVGAEQERCPSFPDRRGHSGQGSGAAV